MSQEEEHKFVTIVEEREERMVSHTGGNGIPTLRLARFLKPSIASLHEAAATPPPLLPKTQAQNFQKGHLTVHFKGWIYPLKNWKQWVDDLKPRYETTWKKTGIYDSIIISTYNILKEEDLVLGLAEFWCPETNTFVFSWGEATITLEDVLIIAGVPVLGESVTSPLTGDLLAIENKLTEEYYNILRSRAHKVEYTRWLSQFMGNGGELEHPAFLSLWLSRFIFPMKSDKTMSKQVFPIAIHLSQATRIALAPALLASLYRDLRVLKEQIQDSVTEDCFPATVWAPFQIIHLWAWERFLSLQPTPNFLSPGDPRAARWNNLKSNLKANLLRTILDSCDGFQWRPYSYILNNWQHPLYGEEQRGWVITSPNMNEEVLSFCRCIMPCELVGLDCMKQYVPHRVGMQFGIDQDIPGPFAKATANWKIDWRTNGEPIRKISFYIPTCHFESDVTERYFNWWRQFSKINQNATESISVCQISSSSLEVSSKSSESESFVSPCPGKQFREDTSSDNEDKMTISEWCNHSLVLLNDRAATPSKYFSSPQVQCTSSTPNGKASEKKPMIKSLDNCLKDIIELDMDSRSEASVDICYPHVGVIDTVEGEFPGLQLEARIEKLEVIVNKLKTKRRRANGKHKLEGV